MKLITELMQIISRHKNDQIMNIYDELTDIQLIGKFGGVPKLVQVVKINYLGNFKSKKWLSRLYKKFKKHLNK
jgi:hypothetical protein